jgi:hypothetical protein
MCPWGMGDGVCGADYAMMLRGVTGLSVSSKRAAEPCHVERSSLFYGQHLNCLGNIGELSMAMGAFAFTILNNLVGRLHISSFIEYCSTPVATDLQRHGRLTEGT